MFPPASRYAKADTFEARLPNGTVVTALVLPGPRSPVPIGYHPRAVGDRLDLIAKRTVADTEALVRQDHGGLMTGRRFEQAEQRRR